MVLTLKSLKFVHFNALTPPLYTSHLAKGNWTVWARLHQLTELTPNAVTSQSNNGGGRRNENEAQKFWLHSINISEFSVRFCNKLNQCFAER